jgi:protein-S-isoprenylcysteine O-methyltransferase Ste14
MITKLTVLLAMFPPFQWIFEMLIKWALDDKQSTSFLAAAISSAALGIIAPLAVPKRTSHWSFSPRGDVLSYCALWCLLLGVLAWCFCLIIDLKGAVPPVLGLLSSNPTYWSIGTALAMYSIALWLTVWDGATK